MQALDEAFDHASRAKLQVGDSRKNRGIQELCARRLVTHCGLPADSPVVVGLSANSLITECAEYAETIRGETQSRWLLGARAHLAKKPRDSSFPCSFRVLRVFRDERDTLRA